MPFRDLDAPIAMKQAYRDRLRASVRGADAEWAARSRSAARRLLSAACYREASESALRCTGTALLPPIGFYYSLYHGVIAALYLDWQTHPAALSRARHQAVSRLLDSHLIQRRLLPQSCGELLNTLRVFREYANYTVGGKLREDQQYLNARDQSRTLYDQTGQALSGILGFVRNVSKATTLDPSVSDRIAVTIGDDIGDDVFQMYLSDQDRDRVVRYLVAEGLST